MVTIHEVALAKILAQNNTKDYFLLKPESFDYEFEKESDLYEDEKCTTYLEMVQGVFDEFFNYYLSEILELAGWVCTDPSCNQYRFQVSPKVYKFREDRIINPETGETKVYETEIDLNDYTYIEMFEACETYGHEANIIKIMICENSCELELVAEYLFELDTDAWVM